MCKQILLFLICFLALETSFAQRVREEKEEEETEQEDKSYKPLSMKNFHTGGSVTLGTSFNQFGGNNQTAQGTTLGITPHIGYFITPWLDFGVNINANVQSVRDRSIGVKNSLSQFGAGPYARVLLWGRLFLHYQKEWNNFTYKEKVNGSVNYSQKFKGSSNLAGIGYINGGRILGNELFFYSQILVEINHKGTLSPYVIDNVRIPIFSQGVNIPLFQGKSKKRSRSSED